MNNFLIEFIKDMFSQYKLFTVLLIYFYRILQQQLQIRVHRIWLQRKILYLVLDQH